jgi:hypothetical protein
MPVAEWEIEHQLHLLHPNQFAFSLPSRFAQCQYVPSVLESTAAPQRCNGAQGQYMCVYAFIFPRPIQEIMTQAGVKQPGDLDRITFRDMVFKCLAELATTVVATACFQEPLNHGAYGLGVVLGQGQTVGSGSMIVGMVVVL